MRLEYVEAEQPTPPLQQLGKFQVRHVVMRKTLFGPKALGSKGGISSHVLSLKIDSLTKRKTFCRLLIRESVSNERQRKASACKLPVP